MLLRAEEFLPRMKIESNVEKKIQQIVRDGFNKQFFLSGSSFETSSHDLRQSSFFLDKISFDFEESYERSAICHLPPPLHHLPLLRSFYGRGEYTMSCFCIGDTSRNVKPSGLIQEQLRHAIQGVSSFQHIEESQKQEFYYRVTDLLYLNHFRIFLFFEAQTPPPSLPA